PDTYSRIHDDRETAGRCGRGDKQFLEHVLLLSMTAGPTAHVTDPHACRGGPHSAVDYWDLEPHGVVDYCTWRAARHPPHAATPARYKTYFRCHRRHHLGVGHRDDAGHRTHDRDGGVPTTGDHVTLGASRCSRRLTGGITAGPTAAGVRS